MANRIPKDAPDPIDKYVGSRVRARRIGLRKSQTKLGDAIGVTFQQVQKYENGTNRVGASNLFKIASTLDVNVGYFYEGLEDGTSTPISTDDELGNGVKDPTRSDEALKLMYNYFRIADEQVRTRLFQFIKSLADAEVRP
jgi:transcriptional regulator with XRE-family HTH domain